ncbi:conserved hypothetical protein [Culex quinquefasciatus]|uniref:PDZ domain-containing protein n=1 Tax=Culex quinquefasciatus TaxID=7176 RepID=B0XKZ0_CULQU|nr:conserved hypothetical protein [Culex quinquefasciatus]|eukprot:XP_001870312.1 conserved hypothetical protein [Culex quinquefasciatus]
MVSLGYSYGICSLLRGGIAERGGVRVGHRIIEINNQSVVAVPHEKIVNLLATSVGEDVKTIHLFNIPYEGKVPVAPYIKHFHDCLGMSFTVATVVRGKRNAQFSQEALRNSHAEAYLVYVNAPAEFFTVLETVKSSNPLARCLFVFSKGSYRKAVERLRLAWERFELFNIVISSIDGGNGLVWCIFNPFNGRHYNLAASTEHHTQLADLQNEFTHLLLTGTGIMYNFGTYAFKDTKLRIVTVSLMFSAMIVNNILQGSLIEYLNVPVFNEIDSLNKLLNANINIVTVPFIFKSLQHVTGDRTVQRIKTKLKIMPLPQNRDNPIFTNGRHAFLLPKEKAHSMAETIYDDHGNDLLFIVPEKVHAFYVAFVARRDLFMEWKINKLILQMAQHGVIHYEFESMFSSVRLLQIGRVKEEDSKDPIFKEGRHAFLVPKEKAYSMAETIYDDQGNDLIYVIPEKIHALYVAFVARRELSFAWKIDE